MKIQSINQSYGGKLNQNKLEAKQSVSLRKSDSCDSFTNRQINKNISFKGFKGTSIGAVLGAAVMVLSGGVAAPLVIVGAAVGGVIGHGMEDLCED